MVLCISNVNNFICKLLPVPDGFTSPQFINRFGDDVNALSDLFLRDDEGGGESDLGTMGGFRQQTIVL